MLVYVDVLLLVNFIIDLNLLKCASYLSSKSFSPARCCLASFIGSLGALTLFLPPFSIFTSFVYKLLFASVMVFLAFPYENISSYLKEFFSLIFCTFLFSGLVSFICITLKPSKMKIYNGSLYLDVSMWFLIFSALIFYLIITFLNFILRERHSEEKVCDLKITHKGKVVFLKGLIDTGSSLREPFSNLPVIVTEEKYFPKESNDENALENNLRVVPFSCLAGEGILKAFLPDKVEISLKEKEVKLEKGCYIALTKEKIGKNFYTAIVNPEVLER